MDISLNYASRGAGAPLILLHGNGEDHSYFSRQIADFSRKYRVIAVDTRGHGASPRGSAPFTLAQFARDLKDFMDAQRIPRAHILGFSDGGNIALLFALAHPERVDRLILNGANLFPAGLKPRVRLSIRLDFFRAQRKSAKDARARAQLELLSLMLNEPRIDPSQLSRLTMPALVVAGTRDMIRASHSRLIARSLPNARLCLIPGDHFVAARNPAAFNAAVDDFLSDPV